MLSRRRFLQLSGAALAAAPFASIARPRFDDAFTPLRHSIGVFTQRGGTIGWMAHPEALVVVDTQMPATAKQCWSGLQTRTESGLSLLVNTHHHGDHTGGNPVLGPKASQFVAHANVPRLQRAAADDGATPVVANQTYTDHWERNMGGEVVQLDHYGPAHTGGDTVVFFQNANIAHVGDLVFNRVYPFIDIDGGASITNWMTTLETLYDRFDDDTIVIHGHGHPNPSYGITGSRDDLLAMRDFLAALYGYVARQRQAGASLEEMQQVKQLKGFAVQAKADWPLPLDRCIAAAYREQTTA
ncbi:MBL fold metallo-hydrolase [Salisaeta longa]|uniref:MBL fold metallo-hydrolase n=1 Tax=Salisaeta longa TaxID=503170 RepID=UPI000408EDA9|nr:MBL fold metallo-hydrolase [Salisaeta longa]